jgi:hypothetical protein
MTRSEQSRRDMQIALERKTTPAADVANRHGVCIRTVRRAVRRVEGDVGDGGMLGIALMARQKARLEWANHDLSRLRGRYDAPELMAEIITVQLELMKEEFRLAGERHDLGLE